MNFVVDVVDVVGDWLSVTFDCVGLLLGTLDSGLSLADSAAPGPYSEVAASAWEGYSRNRSHLSLLSGQRQDSLPLQEEEVASGLSGLHQQTLILMKRAKVLWVQGSFSPSFYRGKSSFRTLKPRWAERVPTVYLQQSSREEDQPYCGHRSSLGYCSPHLVALTLSAVACSLPGVVTVATVQYLAAAAVARRPNYWPS